eukprot:CAMPEP_0204261486 /NCGR_PEP_ID=MMETSP0468-20130131/7037_1 /ASSEMBLY_ACC=CAM_ASM_000383 /TAXON_ID=2969 /ORGANISM="Oxyrrhis marina" /LENGTH=123 /DNA_ID=CAMNT_0051236039 /DNA_START=377 /DNA_END=748 /DNA_ORIENTATION=-
MALQIITSPQLHNALLDWQVDLLLSPKQMHKALIAVSDRQRFSKPPWGREFLFACLDEQILRNHSQSQQPTMKAVRGGPCAIQQLCASTRQPFHSGRHRCDLEARTQLVRKMGAVASNEIVVA